MFFMMHQKLQIKKKCTKELLNNNFLNFVLEF